MIELNYIDNFIVFGFLALTLVIAVSISFQKEQNSSDYFLASKKLKWRSIGLSIFASSISGFYFFALTGIESVRGYVTGDYEIITVIFLLLLSLYLGPLYFKSGVFTAPEYLEKRFDRKIRIYAALFQIFVNIFIKITLILFAAGLILKQTLNWDTYTITLVLVILSGLYGLVGGLKAVVYTQIVQVIFSVSAIAILIIFGIHAAGTANIFSFKTYSSSIILLKPLYLLHNPVAGYLLGVPIIAFLYWCTDQNIIQRVLASKTVQDVKKGIYLGAALKLLFALMLIIAGIITVKFSSENNADQPYSLLFLNEILPIGVRGIFIVGVFSLIMAPLSSILHSTSTLLTNDIYRVIYPKSSERELVLMGRLFATFTSLLIILFVPLLKYIAVNNYIYMQSCFAIFGAPIAALFLFGMTPTKINTKGALWGVIIGEMIGLFKVIFDSLVNIYSFSGSLSNFITGINFLYYSAFVFVFTSATMMVVSRLYPAMRAENYKLHGLDVLE